MSILNNDDPLLCVVHCVDTEGPLTETIYATFDRLHDIFDITLEPTRQNLLALQNKEINLNGLENEVAKVVAPELLNYNNNWSEIDLMLDEALSIPFRNELLDDDNRGWVYSWHCMDHIGYSDNPRLKDIGYGNIFRYYKNKLKETNSLQDEINWHFHPLSFTRNPIQCATSYINSMDVLIQILCRRVIDENWFPVCNRPGFHSERPDSHLFLEQWIPFDYANQYYEKDDGQSDLTKGRFGDWQRASDSWNGYHPDHDDYQKIGFCRRKIFRCLNIGTRFNLLNLNHVESAFDEAYNDNFAILSFSNHDYRDIRPDVRYVRQLLDKTRNSFPGVKLKFCGATEAAQIQMRRNKSYVNEPVKLRVSIEDNIAFIDVLEGAIFGPQPFFCFKTLEGRYYHDNLDCIIPQKRFKYVFDSHTININAVDIIAAATADRCGNYSVDEIIVNTGELI